MIAFLLAVLLAPRFPSDNVWNHQISTLPVHPMSSYWVLTFFPESKGFAINPDPSCGLPINRTGPGWQRMTFDWPAESDTCLYPYSSTQPFESCNPDSHWAAVDTTTNTLYEMYGVHGAAQKPSAGAGARWNLSSNAVRADGGTSADEAGLPISPGLLDFDEAHLGSIRHALRFALSWPYVDNSYVWPARHVAFRQHAPHAIPLGMRMRLKASYIIPADASPEVRAILQAMKDYGLFLADRAGDVYGEFSLEAVPDPRWRVLLAELAARTVGIRDNLEFVDESKFMADPNSGRWKARGWLW